MALEMPYTGADGTVYPQCYIVLGAIVLSEHPAEATLCTNFYADASVFAAGGLPLVQPAYQSELSLFDVGPAFSVAYQYLLTLPDFAGAHIVADVVH
ncbi:MAG: hypothetical protein KGS10_16200 [Chloroflexi bacterium]|nr:hypothetical protein [Chloroflexota bacterium]